MGGVPGGVVGGVVGGVLGGVPGGVIGGVLGGVLRSVPDTAAVARVQQIQPAPEEPKIVRVSEGIASGMLICKVVPEYPELARLAHISGAVVLSAIIDENGEIKNLQVVSGHPLLVQAAIEAVQQWRYKPWLLNQHPIEVETQVTVNFTLNRGG